jgi:hypothetical protein
MFDNSGSMMDETDDGVTAGAAMAGEMASALADHVDRMQEIMDRYGIADMMDDDGG